MIDRLADPSVNWFSYCTIEGTPYIFSTQELPALWIPPGMINVAALDITRGIMSEQSPLGRKAGIATAKNMRIKIGPQHAPEIRKYLSPEAATWRAKLDADFTYSETAQLAVDTAGGPAAPGYVYLGNEAILTTGTYGSGYTLVAGGREQFGSVRGDFRSDRTKYVTDQPELFEGRIVHLWGGLSDAGGVPIDATLYGANQWELFAGKIQSLAPGDDFETWEMNVSGLEECVNLELGAEDVRGHMHVYASDAAPQGAVGYTDSFRGGYILPGLDRVVVVASDSGASATVVCTISSGWHTDLLGDIAAEVETQLNAAPIAWAGTWKVTGGSDSEGTLKLDGDLTDVKGTGTLIFSSTDLVGPVSVDLPLQQGAALPQTQWVPAAPEVKVSGISGETWHVWTWERENFAVFLSSVAKEVAVVLEEPSKWTAPLYVTIGDDEEAEVALVSAVTPLYTGSVYKLTFSERGALGTKARDAFLRYDENEGPQTDNGGMTWLLSTAQIQLSAMAGFDGDVFSMLLSAAVSTGTAGIRGAYDVAGIPKGYGGALSIDLFDTASFEEARDLTRDLLADRLMGWRRPLSLRTWISEELSFLGYTLQARRTQSGRFRLTLDRVLDPLLISTETLVADDVAPVGRLSLSRYGQGIVNTASVQATYNPATEEFLGKPWVVNEIDSQERYGKRPAFSMRARGLAKSVATARVGVIPSILGLLSHYSKPYEILTVSTKRSFWRYQPGDQINVTLPMLPSADGTKGWTDEPCVVLSVSARYIGKGKTPAATVSLLRMPRRRMSYYVPTAEVVGWHAPSKTLTLAPNSFSSGAIPFPEDPSLLCADILWFAEQPADLMIANEGDEANQEIVTVASYDIAANTITLTAVPTLTPGTDTVIYFPDYDNCTTRQKLYVHLADSNATLGAAADAAFQYTG